MKRLLKKKVNLFGKEVSILVIALLGIVMVSAALIPYFGKINQSFEIVQGVALSGTGCTNGVCIESLNSLNACGSETSNIYNLESSTSEIVPLSIETNVGPTEEGLTTTEEYLLSATGSQGVESRIFIKAEDANIDSLNNLISIEWESYVENLGYLSHVDVIIDTDGDGIKDDALVFEYDKVEGPSDQSNLLGYPNNNVGNMNFGRDMWVNTFDDKGIVDGDAQAWLSSACSGDINSPYYISTTLNEWKNSGLTRDYEGCEGDAGDTMSINGNTKVLGFEIEVDSWIVDTNAKVKNIKINDQEVKVSLKPNDELSFDILTEADCLIQAGGYTVNTTVTAR